MSFAGNKCSIAVWRHVAFIGSLRSLGLAATLCVDSDAFVSDTAMLYKVDM